MRVKRHGKREIRQHWFEKNAYEVFRNKVAKFEDTYILERYKIELKAREGDAEAAKKLLEKYHARVLARTFA